MNWSVIAKKIYRSRHVTNFIRSTNYTCVMKSNEMVVIKAQAKLAKYLLNIRSNTRI